MFHVEFSISKIIEKGREPLRAILSLCTQKITIRTYRFDPRQKLAYGDVSRVRRTRRIDSKWSVCCFTDYYEKKKITVVPR